MRTIDLLTGGTGQTSKTPDARITDVNTLPAGPFQLTNGSTFPYDAYAASPVHRFYQMWQQLNCSVERASASNPSGCNGKLFSWVEVTVGAGTNGAAQPKNFSTEYSPAATTTGEGSTALGFYNVQQGDVPYFKSLADKYAMSDNFHQSVDGGTGANHIMFGHADAIWFSDADGKPGRAAAEHDGVLDLQWRRQSRQGCRARDRESESGRGHQQLVHRGRLRQQPKRRLPTALHGGARFRRRLVQRLLRPDRSPACRRSCAYLASLPRPIDPRCEPGHYYLLNNYNPGYFGNGKNAYADTNPANTPFTIPPSSTPSIGDDLNAHRHFLEVLRRSVEQLRARSLPDELRHAGTEGGRVLQHLQPVPVRHLHHGAPGSGGERTSRTRRTCTPTSRTTRCPPSPSSSRAATPTDIRPPPSSICSKAS